MSVSVLIEQSVLDGITDRSKSNRPNEAGGLLLGYRKGNDLHVVDLTGPLPMDVASPVRFFRKDPGHQRDAARKWKGSRETLDWVGEWHSHPNGTPYPSSIDETTWRTQVRRRSVSMAYIINGADSHAVWLVNPLTLTVVPLCLIGADNSATLFELR